jgi:catechol 2,3-dioxygenase-like lactoylglutathione lyase family enzyme
MAVDFNHTIVWVRDSEASARFLSQSLGLPPQRLWGPFQVVTTANGTNLDFMNAKGEINPQHYAFLVSESEFDEIFDRVRQRAIPYWADPAQTQVDEINYNDGGRGFYFEDPNGHLRSSPALMAVAKCRSSTLNTKIGYTFKGAEYELAACH